MVVYACRAGNAWKYPAAVHPHTIFVAAPARSRLGSYLAILIATVTVNATVTTLLRFIFTALIVLQHPLQLAVVIDALSSCFSTRSALRAEEGPLQALNYGSAAVSGTDNESEN